MRIVSLCPSLTELVFDLGRGKDLVGITRYCVHPREALESIETVGGTKDPDVERIVALRPDVVLLNAEENRLEDAEALEGAGLKCHASLPKTIEDTAAMVRSIGEVLDRSQAAERIAEDIEARASRVRAAAAVSAPVRFAYLIWRKPWMAVNDDTFASALLSLAGGLNVFGAHEQRYPVVESSELTRANPDLVLLGSEPFPFEERHKDELAAVTGLARERFLLADGEYLSWHGSRTRDGIDYAESLIQKARRVL